jgi:hypothetical protein
MTNENNGRIAGQSSASYKLAPITGKTKKQQRKPKTQLEKLSKAIAFVKALKPLLFITYRFTCEKVSYYNCAVKHVLHWISGTPPDLVVDYSKILVASGNRFNTERAVAKPVGDTILFKWENDLIPANYATDKTILVVYCEALNKCIYTTMGPPRTVCKAKLEVTAFRGQAVHTWLSFISADGRQVADSIYTGKLIVDS